MRDSDIMLKTHTKGAEMTVWLYLQPSQDWRLSYRLKYPCKLKVHLTPKNACHYFYFSLQYSVYSLRISNLENT